MGIMSRLAVSKEIQIGTLSLFALVRHMIYLGIEVSNTYRQVEGMCECQHHCAYRDTKENA